jgi:hypothetical protein
MSVVLRRSDFSEGFLRSESLFLSLSLSFLSSSSSSSSPMISRELRSMERLEEVEGQSEPPV